MELLEKHFDTAFAAPNGINKLREFILALAMKGELVSQNPKDQSARKILKEVADEKQRLVNEKKIRKLKPLSDIKPDQTPYKIPSSWEWCHLDNICTLITDGTHHTPTYTESGIPFISVKNVSSGKMDFSKTRYISTREHDELIKRCHPEKGDILLTKVGTTGIAVAIKTSKEFSLFVSVALLKFVPHSVDVDYITSLLNSPLVKKYSSDGTEGVGNKNLVLRKIKAFIVPLPPLEEQHRIVAKINQLMARCDELEKLRAERDRKQITVHTAALNRLLTAPDTDTFTQSWQFITKHFSELYSVKENVTELRKAILQLAVMGKLVPQSKNDPSIKKVLETIKSERDNLVKNKKIRKYKPLPEIKIEDIPYQLPENWKWVRLTDIVDVGTGSTPSKANHEYYNGEIPWYTSSATNNTVAEKPNTYITEKALSETNCKIFPAGSLIIALYGQGKTRGQISELAEAGATNQAIAAMIFYESSLEMKSYVKYYFVKIYEEIRSRAEGGAQPNLNVGKVKDTLIPLPSIPEQHRIVTKVDQLMALCDQLEQQIDTATHKQTALLNAVIAKV